VRLQGRYADELVRKAKDRLGLAREIRIRG